jgi:hypothetical protein
VNRGQAENRESAAPPSRSSVALKSERIEPDALKQTSAVIATVLYHAAMRDGKFPR